MPGGSKWGTNAATEVRSEARQAAGTATGEWGRSVQAGSTTRTARALSNCSKPDAHRPRTSHAGHRRIPPRGYHTEARASGPWSVSGSFEGIQPASSMGSGYADRRIGMPSNLVGYRPYLSTDRPFPRAGPVVWLPVLVQAAGLLRWKTAARVISSVLAGFAPCGHEQPGQRAGHGEPLACSIPVTAQHFDLCRQRPSEIDEMAAHRSCWR